MNIYRVSSLLLAHTRCFRIFEFVHFVLVSLCQIFRFRYFRDAFAALAGFQLNILSTAPSLFIPGTLQPSYSLFFWWWLLSFWPSLALLLSGWSFFVLVFLLTSSHSQLPKKSTNFLMWAGGGATLRLLPSVFFMWMCCCCQVVGSAFVVTVCGEKYS